MPCTTPTPVASAVDGTYLSVAFLWRFVFANRCHGFFCGYVTVRSTAQPCHVGDLLDSEPEAVYRASFSSERNHCAITDEEHGHAGTTAAKLLKEETNDYDKKTAI